MIPVASSLRSKKNDPYNHLIAGAVTFPALAVLARSKHYLLVMISALIKISILKGNRAFWATGFAIWGGLFVALLKAIGKGDVYLGKEYKSIGDKPVFSRPNTFLSEAK
jgi:hypothetical protein